MDNSLHQAAAPGHSDTAHTDVPYIAAPHIELLPPSLIMRIGKRRLTLSRRARKPVSQLLSRLLQRSWRAMFGRGLRVSLAAAAACAAWNTTVMAATAPPASTLPTGGTVTYGNATISQSGNTLTINQTSNQAIATFTTFSIGSGAEVDINQPSAAASFLARVTGSDPSLIYGLLKSNGTVALINQNGILVGPGGVVDVARFIASTLNITDADFLAGRLNFTGVANSTASVDNEGTIKSASGGSVYLIGSNVSNNGVIQSANGEILLAAGQTVQLVDTGTPGVTVNITGAAGNVTNLGTITAAAGTIGIAAGLINNSGSINASSVVADGGRIFLRASDSLTTSSTSTIAADGAANGGSVVLYSSGSAFIDGSVSATGGTGTGGYVETSGLTSLDVVNAPTVGAGGTWYIDPYDLTVVSDSNNSSPADNSGGGPYAVTSNSNGGTSGSTIKASCISYWLGLDENVVLSTSGDSGIGGSGNITVNAAITKSAGSYAALTLDADANININANITSTSGVLDVNLITNYRHQYQTIQGVTLSGATIALNGGILNVSDGSSVYADQGSLHLTNGSVLNLSYNGSENSTQGGSVYTGNLSVEAGSSVIGLADGGSNLVVSGTYTNDGFLSLANMQTANISELVNGSTGSVTLNNVTLNTTNVSNAGTLVLSGNAALSAADTIDNSGTLNLTSSSIFTNFSNADSSFINEASGTVSANYLSTLSANVSNAGTMTLDSTANKPNGYSGSTAIALTGNFNNSGTLNLIGTLTNNGNINNALGGNITVASNAVITGGNWNNSGNLTLGSGSLLNSADGELDNNSNASLVMNNATLLFAAINNNEGGTLSGTGSMTITGGTFVNSGTFAPGGTGTVGTVNITGNYEQNSTGTLSLDVASSTSYDQINVSGSVALDGTVQTSLLNSYAPEISTYFQPFGSNAQVSGVFRHVLGDVVTNSSGGLQMFKALSADGEFYMAMCGSADITFQGSGGSSWSNLSNWSTGYYPTAIDNVIVTGGTELDHIASDGIDIVRNITIGSGSTFYVSGGNVTATNISVDGSSYLTVAAGTVQTVNLTSNGSVTVGQIENEANATLNVSGTASLTNLTLYTNGQVISTNSSSVFNVTGNISDDGGTINSSGSVILAQTDSTTVDLTVGNITAANLVLQAQNGSISQSDTTDVLHVTKQLATASATGTTLDSTGNQIAAYTGVNTGSGDIVLVNNLNTSDTSVVTINGINNVQGNISIDNTGAMKTAARTSTGVTAVDTAISGMNVSASGLILASAGNVTLATHSPLTIGSGGITSYGNIALSAGDGTSVTDVLSINGNITSTHGYITPFVSNATLYGEGATLTDLNGSVTPNPFPTSSSSSTSDTSSSNALLSSVDSMQNSNSSSSQTPTTDSTTSSSNTSSSTTFTTSDGQTMTTGGDDGSFGGSDSGDGSGSGSKPAAAPLTCS